MRRGLVLHLIRLAIIQPTLSPSLLVSHILITFFRLRGLESPQWYQRIHLPYTKLQEATVCYLPQISRVPLRGPFSHIPMGAQEDRFHLPRPDNLKM